MPHFAIANDSVRPGPTRPPGEHNCYVIRPDGPDRISVRDGLDTDADGHPDTVAFRFGQDPAVAADTDGDGFADLIIRFGQDGGAAIYDLDGEPWDVPLDDGWTATDLP